MGTASPSHFHIYSRPNAKAIGMAYAHLHKRPRHRHVLLHQLRLQLPSAHPHHPEGLQVVGQGLHLTEDAGGGELISTLRP